MIRNLSRLALILVLSLLTVPGSAQSPTRPVATSYVVLMTDAPVIAYEGGIAGYTATKPGRGRKLSAQSAHVRRYAQRLEARHHQALAGAGVPTSAKVHSYTVALNGFSALLTAAEVAAIRTQPGILMVVPDQRRHKATDSSPGFLGLAAPGGPYERNLNGEGVVVGVIDTGIWPEHPSFADDGSYGSSPVGPVPCEFGNTAQNPNDAPFTCNKKLLGARQFLATYRAMIGIDPDEYDSARDDEGHGTHTASTAAGNAGVQASIYGIPRGPISGIAPRARIIAYKGLGNEGGFSSDLAAAIDQAVADGVDVINYSIGSTSTALGADDIAFLFAADAGVFVATSAGNSGPGVSTIGSPAIAPWLTSVGASTQSRFFQGTVVLGNGASYPGASITAGTGPSPLIDAAGAGSEFCVPGMLTSAVAGKIVLCRRGVVGRAAKSRAVFQRGGAGMIQYNTSDADNLFTDTHWVPSVHIDNTPGQAIKAYIASASSPTARILAGEISQWAPAPSMTIFSSRGPNGFSPDIIKPDVTAPGIQILAGNSPTPDPGGFPGELFQAIAGTSMSSPHVAGLFALLKQAHPDWSAAMAKSALMTTALQDVRDNDRVSPARPFAMGAGHVNPGGKANKGSLFEPGLAYDAGLSEYFGFLCDAEPAIFTDPAATCAELQAAGVPIAARDLNLASIGVAAVPGTLTVTRRVISVARENGHRIYTVSVDAPAGYNITVSPASFRLRRGETATYQVTITNVSAPAGAWRFGSLTWRDNTGHYEVRSPIAVRAQ